jgi:hypothetical protein
MNDVDQVFVAQKLLYLLKAGMDPKIINGTSEV